MKDKCSKVLSPGVLLDVDQDKIDFIEACLTVIYFAQKCYVEGKKVEVLEALTEVAFISLKVPDHRIAAVCFECIGVFNK